jgi:hypothetical protein
MVNIAQLVMSASVGPKSTDTTGTISQAASDKMPDDTPAAAVPQHDCPQVQRAIKTLTGNRKYE